MTTRFFDDKPFAGKTFIVTGAAGGIGWPTVRLLADGGAKLVLNDINAEKLDALAEDVSDRASVRCVVSDLSTPEACRELVAAAEGPIFGIVHLAGIFVPTNLGEDARDNYDRTLAANSTNAFDLCVAALPHMQEGGTVVLISSLAYMRGSPMHIPYSMAKGALVGLTRGLSRRVGAKGIRVNALTPGIILTDMPAHIVQSEQGQRYRTEIPMQRFGEAEEVADVIAFFCSPASRYVTGQLLGVDGGVVNG